MSPHEKIDKPEDLRKILDDKGMHGVPVFALPGDHRPPTTAEHFFTNCRWVLEMQGFKIDKEGSEYVLRHGKDPKTLVTAPAINDLMLMLCVAGAWVNVKE